MEKEERLKKYKELTDCLNKAKSLMDELSEEDEGYPISARIDKHSYPIHGIDTPKAFVAVQIYKGANNPFDDMEVVETNDNDYPHTYYKNVDDVTFFAIGK